MEWLENHLICPITMCIMEDPVMASDGHSYDRKAIEQWIQTRQTSPKTNLPLNSITLKPNLTLKFLIEDYHKHKHDISLSSNNSDESVSPKNKKQRQLETSPYNDGEERILEVIVPDTYIYRDSSPYSKRTYEMTLKEGELIATNEYMTEGIITYAKISNFEGWVNLSHFKIISLIPVDRIYSCILPMAYRIIPNYADEWKASDAAHTGCIVQVNHICINSLGIVFLRVKKNGKSYWIFEEKANEMMTTRLTIKNSNSPTLYKVVNRGGLALRESPDYSPDCTVHPLEIIPYNDFIKSTSSITGEHRDTFVRVSQNGTRGWLFVTREGKACLQKVNPLPDIVVDHPGELVHLALGRHRDHWVFVEDNLTRTSQSAQWGNKIPHGLKDVFDNCAINKRRIKQFVISQDGESWCCETTDLKGNASHWNYGGMSDNFNKSMNKLSVKHVCLGTDAFTYCILLNNGGYFSQGLSDQLLNRIQAARCIKTLCLFGNNEYYIKDNNGSQWICSNDFLSDEIRKNHNSICSVFKCGNSGEWIILTNTKSIISTGVPQRLKNLVYGTYNQYSSKVDEHMKLKQRYEMALTRL